MDCSNRPRYHEKTTINIAFHRIPIYDLRFWVGVSDKPVELRAKFDWAFGKRDNSDFSGTCEYHRSKFAVLFDAYDLSHELIAHEVFHVTHRMLEFNAVNFGENNHEPFAYLNGYLTQLVYVDLAKFKWPVRLKMHRVKERFVRP